MFRNPFYRCALCTYIPILLILIYSLNSHEDVKVYFHKNGQFLDLSGRMGYKIYKKEKVQSQVNGHDIRYVF